MPANRSEIHIDAALTSLSLAYQNEGFVADILAPRVRVAKDSDKYYIYDAMNMTPQDDARARASKSKEIDFSMSTATYNCKRHSLAGLVAAEDYRNADVPLRPEADMVRVVQEGVQLNREIRVATLYQTAGNYGGNTAAAAAGWNAAATDIEAEIRTAIAEIKKDSQKLANTIVIPFETALKMGANTQIRDAKKNFVGGMPLLSVGLPPNLFGLNVVIPSAGKNTAKKGQTETFADIWTDSVTICYLEQNPGLYSRSFAVSFDSGGSVVRRFELEENQATKVEYEDVGLDEKIISPGSGYLITNTIQ